MILIFSIFSEIWMNILSDLSTLPKGYRHLCHKGRVFGNKVRIILNHGQSKNSISEIYLGVEYIPWPSEVLPQREVGSLKYETGNTMPLRPA